MELNKRLDRVIEELVSIRKTLEDKKCVHKFFDMKLGTKETGEPEYIPTCRECGGDIRK